MESRNESERQKWKKRAERRCRDISLNILIKTITNLMEKKNSAMKSKSTSLALLEKETTGNKGQVCAQKNNSDYLHFGFLLYF